MITSLYYLCISIFFPILKQHESSKVRLEKQVEKTSFETIVEKACPYIILACMIILCVLLFIALVKYGHAFSTEANQYEHLHQIITQ